jgi:hypothetical protein
MSSLISAKILICEKALQEPDGVISAIRMVDVFYFTPRAALPIDQQAVAMVMVASGQVVVGDEAEHDLEFYLVRPDGERKLLGDPTKMPFKSTIPGAPAGFAMIANIGVVPKQMGTHYFALLFDNEEVARAPFTLVERKQEPSE